MSERKDIGLEDLLLDDANPRLPLTVGRSQQDMVEYLARTTSITELMTAIGKNDYFPGEPLVVIPGSGDKHVVVEGNRRLAALRLLADPELYPKSRKIREASEEAKFKPNVIPCVVFQSREDVVNYLGYRHITGVKQWEPLAKARYIAAYFDNHTDQKSDIGARYLQVARGIGSHWPFIKRQLDSLAFYNLVEKKGFFEIENLDEENISFSLISTALGYESILKFVSESEHPYVEDKKFCENEVELLTRWFFEPNDKGETRLGDSRNIKRLAIIIADQEARTSLVEGDSLNRAYSLTRGVADDFLEILVNVENNISRAVSMISLVDIDESHRSRVSNIFKQARSLRNLSDED
tara:strand:+ start:308 stop:1363 length:1056 start_codon:yes stop_codon:yes gene_type:complete